MGKDEVKAILFDSGRVLNHPSTGNWFIGPKFFDYVDRDVFESIDEERRNNSFSKALNHVEGYKLILTEEEEFKRFEEFYGLLAVFLGELRLNREAISNIARDTVYNDEKFYFPEEVFEVIPKLSEKYKLGVLSNTWPSLERVFKNNGLRKYFATFVMSSVVGVEKPDKEIFEIALDELNLKPEEVIFIDDNIDNVKVAKELGMKGLVLSDEEIEGEKYITNLKELVDIL